MQGIVFKSTGSRYKVKGEDGLFYIGGIRGKMRLSGIKSTNPVAVGDSVDFEVESGNLGVITHLNDRKNYLVRKSTNLSKQVHVLAANIDQVLMICTIVQPKIALGLVDRVLATAEAYEIPAVLVFNKFDIYSEEDKDKLAGILSIYDPIGYPCIITSATEKRGIEKLKTVLQNKTTLLTGHSGVGKSSLINTIDPNLQLKTGEISHFNEKGQHTTTFAEMHELSFGAQIIDTPGVRSFGVFDFDKSVLAHYFPEMLSKSTECRFHNCTHVNEPGCAIKQTIEEGGISAQRYQSYLNLFFDEDLEKSY
jgi:ribosome biogenesis GTPase